MRFFREILYEVVKLIGLAGLALPFPADVVEQFVHQDQRGAVREKRLDHVAARRDSLLVVASYHVEGFGSAELPGDLSPGSVAFRFAASATPAGERVKLLADENGSRGLGNSLDLSMLQDRPDTLPVVCLGSGLCQMIKQGFGVGLAASKLGGHVEDGRGLDRDAGKPPGRLGGQVSQVPRQVSPLEEPLGVLIILAGFTVANEVEVHREFRCVQGSILAQILARRDNVEPRFELGHGAYSPAASRIWVLSRAVMYIPVCSRSSTTGSTALISPIRLATRTRPSVPCMGSFSAWAHRRAARSSRIAIEPECWSATAITLDSPSSSFQVVTLGGAGGAGTTRIQPARWTA